MSIFSAKKTIAFLIVLSFVTFQTPFAFAHEMVAPDADYVEGPAVSPESVVVDDSAPASSAGDTFSDSGALQPASFSPETTPETTPYSPSSEEPTTPATGNPDIQTLPYDPSNPPEIIAEPYYPPLNQEEYDELAKELAELKEEHDDLTSGDSYNVSDEYKDDWKKAHEEGDVERCDEIQCEDTAKQLEENEAAQQDILDQVEDRGVKDSVDTSGEGQWA